MPGRRLGAGKEAEVFACGPDVLKLYRRPEAKSAAFREAAILATVEATGLPVPAVLSVDRFGERWGVRMSAAPGRSFGEMLDADPAEVAPILDELARLQQQVHRLPGTGLTSLKARLAARIGQAPRLDDGLRRNLFSRLDGLPDGDRLCHGDFHPWNVIGERGAPVIVDWLDATSGPPVADLCRSFLLLRTARPGLADAWLDASLRAGRTERSAVLNWLPVLAGARLAEGVGEEEAEILGAMAGQDLG